MAKASVPVRTTIEAQVWKILSHCCCALESIIFSSAKQQAIDVRFIDASATGETAPVVLRLLGLQRGTHSIKIDPPYLFTEGCILQVSSTGAGFDIVTIVGGSGRCIV